MPFLFSETGSIHNQAINHLLSQSPILTPHSPPPANPHGFVQSEAWQLRERETQHKTKQNSQLPATRSCRFNCGAVTCSSHSLRSLTLYNPHHGNWAPTTHLEDTLKGIYTSPRLLQWKGRPTTFMYILLFKKRCVLSSMFVCVCVCAHSCTCFYGHMGHVMMGHAFCAILSNPEKFPLLVCWSEGRLLLMGSAESARSIESYLRRIIRNETLESAIYKWVLFPNSLWLISLLMLIH